MSEEENHSLRLAIKTMFTNSRTNYILKKLGLLDSFGYNDPANKKKKKAEMFAQKLLNMSEKQRFKWADLQLKADDCRNKFWQAESNAKSFFNFHGSTTQEKEKEMEACEKYVKEIEYVENNLTNAEKTMHWKQGEML